MSTLFDKVGRLAGKVSEKVQERVGSAVEEALLPDDARIALLTAERLMGQRRWADALVYLARLERIRPGLARAHFLRGWAHFECGRPAQAQPELAAAAAARPSVEIYLALARTEQALGHDAAAESALLAALAHDPAHPLRPELLRRLASLSLAAGQTARASLLVTLSDIGAAPPAWHDTLAAEVALAQGQSAEALALLRAAPPATPAEQALLGQALLATGQAEAALAAFGQALTAAAPRGEAAWIDGAAAAALELDRRSEAAAFLSQRPSHAPATPLYALVMGRLVLEQDPAQALAHFAGALVQAPGDLPLRLGAVEAAWRLGDYATALDQAQPGAAQAAVLAACAALAAVARGDLPLARHFLAPPRRRGDHALLGVAAAALGLAEGTPHLALATLHHTATQPAQLPSPWREHALALSTQAHEELRDAAIHPVPEDLDVPHTIDAIEARRLLCAALPCAQNTERALARLLEDRHRPLQIAVVGEFNAGKSTLINAILDERVCHEGVLPTTLHSLHLGHGLDKPPLPPDPNHRNLTLPHPILAHLNLIDTPGYNANDDAHDLRANQALDQADLVIWVLSALQALSLSQQRLAANISQAHARLLVVVNKIDALAPDEIHQVQDFVSQHLRHRARDLFLLSGRDALQGNDRAPGWQRFIHCLRDIAIHHQRERASALARRANAHLAALHGEASEHRDQCQTWRAELEAARTLLDAHRDQARRELQDLSQRSRSTWRQVVQRHDAFLADLRLAAWDDGTAFSHASRGCADALRALIGETMAQAEAILQRCAAPAAQQLGVIQRDLTRQALARPHWHQAAPPDLPLGLDHHTQSLAAWLDGHARLSFEGGRGRLGPGPKDLAALLTRDGAPFAQRLSATLDDAALEYFDSLARLCDKLSLEVAAQVLLLQSALIAPLACLTPTTPSQPSERS